MAAPGLEDGGRRLSYHYDTKAERYHGAFAHWIDGRTGKTIPFSTFDDGGHGWPSKPVVNQLLQRRDFS